MRYSLTVDSASSGQVVTTAEARLFCRQDGNADDTLIDGLVSAAVEEFEGATARRLLTQTLLYRLDRWTFGEQTALVLPVAPVQSVTHVKYYNDAGTLTTWDSAQYQVNTGAVPCVITPAPDYSWPSIQQGRLWSVEVKFICGYGAASAVPERIKLAIKSIVADAYENREGAGAGNGRAVARPIIMSSRVHWFGGTDGRW